MAHKTTPRTIPSNSLLLMSNSIWKWNARAIKLIPQYFFPFIVCRFVSMKKKNLFSEFTYFPSLSNETVEKSKLLTKTQLKNVSNLRFNLSQNMFTV